MRVMTWRALSISPSGLVRPDKRPDGTRKPRQEDFELLQQLRESNTADAAESAAISMGALTRGPGRAAAAAAAADANRREVPVPVSAPAPARFGVPVTLGVTCRVEEGQRLAVTGAPPALGGWDLQYGRATRGKRAGHVTVECQAKPSHV
jgi:hypothetical protein